MKKDYCTFIENGCVGSGYGVYPNSVRELCDTFVFMAEEGGRDVLVSTGDLGFTGEKLIAGGRICTVAELTHSNACVLRSLFPFTAPVAVLDKPRTIGLGDRLGIATPGHIRSAEKYDAFAVFAQQSMRELDLTGRDYEAVLDAVSFAVYREGYERGFGADGDHLKTPEQIEYALGCGYTMITLDCSEHIRNDVDKLDDVQVTAQYSAGKALESRYDGRTFVLEDHKLTFEAADFRRMYLIYGAAIDFAANMYRRFFSDKQGLVDFEISIDETLTPTTPEQHFFVANELIMRGVKFASLAPRFCGEFQKGVDYRGDLERFGHELAVHAAVARHFGYKLSVHSGSDKFSVFPMVGRHTRGVFHVKTAGTSWLEAMRVIAVHEPSLYREIHIYALSVFDEARKYYHVSTVLGNIPDIAALTDAELVTLFENDDARQLIHITYGLILGAEQNGSKLFYDRLYAAWRKHREEYYLALDKHITKHLSLLYGGMEKGK